MILERRFQKLPRYAYCTDKDCGWTDSTGINPEPEAVAHVDTTGHETRVVISQQIILTGRRVLSRLAEDQPAGAR